MRTRSRWLPVFFGLLLLPLHVARAQNEGLVEALAPLLAAEDARRFDAALLRRSLLAPETEVRRQAALSAGRLRDPRAIALLLPMLSDTDYTVRANAAFSLGLIQDSTAVAGIIRRFKAPDSLDLFTAGELITALAKIGGADAAAFMRGILSGSELAGGDLHTEYVRQVVSEAWRLGPLAPKELLLPYLQDRDQDLRWRAYYSVGRLRVPAALDQMLDALRDPNPYIRATAARTLTRGYADSAGAPPRTIADLLVQTADDPDPGVRISALRSLGGYHLPDLSARVATLGDDPVPNVAVQAAATLGDLGGPDAVAGLTRLVGKSGLARRREALIALARVDSTQFFTLEPAYSASADWRERAAAAEAWAEARPAGVARYLSDRDPRVVAAALQAWSGKVEGPNPDLVAAARRLLRQKDAAVRSVAADAVARAADPSDLPGLSAAYAMAARDSFPDAALSALAALAAIAHASDANGQRVNREFLAGSSAPENYLLRRWAEENWPEAASHWGAAYPLETGRTLEDYRGIARKFILDTGRAAMPHVTIEMEKMGPIELQLYGPDAPLTVANFLRLVDRRFFDGTRWHRVVPNFVVQGGDPRGDGWGGPGTVIRDELNRRRYSAFVVGMALSGPDTGGSQWFITLSPQPHLDGNYTVFGRVVDGIATLNRISQGDQIRSIHR